MYAVNLKQSGTVNFEYYYPDSSIIFEFFVSPWLRGRGAGGGGKVGGKDPIKLIYRNHTQSRLGDFHSRFSSGENCGQNELELQELKKRWKSKDPGGEQYSLGES